MPKFVIEREISGIGRSTPEELQAAARESNTVVRGLGPDIQWITSYVTDDKIYCVYMAADEDVLNEHARCLNLPANRISRVVETIDPATGE